MGKTFQVRGVEGSAPANTGASIQLAIPAHLGYLAGLVNGHHLRHASDVVAPQFGHRSAD